MQKRRIRSLIISMIAILTILLVFVEGVRSTSTQVHPSSSNPAAGFDTNGIKLDDSSCSSPIVGHEMGGGELENRQPPPSPIPETQSTPVPGENDEDTHEPIKEIYFPYEGLSGGIKKALNDLFLEMENGTRSKIGGTLYEFEVNIPDYEQDLKNVRLGAWKVSISIAGILAPLILSLVVLASLKDGATSITGYAVARESLLKWIISIVTAASSYFLLEKVIDLSKALESAIRSQFINSNTDIIHGIGAGQLADSLIPSPSGFTQLGVLLLIILIIFSLLLFIAYTAALTVSWFATKVIIIFVVTIAPIILVIGVLPPFRWLQGLWFKMTTIALFLWPVNTLMLGIFSKVIAIFISGENASVPNTFFAYFIAVGVISIFIAVNSITGKLVYGSALEIALKAKYMVSNLASLATDGSAGILLAGVSGDSTRPISGGFAGSNQKSKSIINQNSPAASTQSIPTPNRMGIDNPSTSKWFGNLQDTQNELAQQINTEMSGNTLKNANLQEEKATVVNSNTTRDFETNYHSRDKIQKMNLHTRLSIEDIQSDVSEASKSSEKILRKMKKSGRDDSINKRSLIKGSF